tara:strand:- start:354 stop:530 length:177 start_codon:yes stop_codon:yes gene_type:complete
MEWIAENWFWLLIGVLFIVMHLFGHGGHGSHGGHSGHGGQEDNGDEKRSGTGSGHHHH